MSRRIKLILAIRSLNIGGAERQFLELVKKIDTTRFDVSVLSMYPGTLDHEINSLPGIRFYQFEKKGRYDFSFIFKCIRFLRSERADAIYAFMLDMNVLMSICAKMAMVKTKIAWGIFGSEPDFSAYDPILKRTFQIQKALEGTADLIIADSTKGIEFLRKYHYKLRNGITIFSGTNTQRFKPDAGHRQQFREQHGLKGTDIAIGICSRLDPMKGYHVLAQAAHRLCTEFDHVHFFSVGYGIDSIKTECDAVLQEHAARFHWMGKQLQPETIMPGWDIYCSCSLYGEGFSNSIIEAMSSGLPVVATDVGDAVIQMKGVGKIVQPGDADALYEALKAYILSVDLEQQGERSREKVLRLYSSEVMTRNTEQAIIQLTQQN